MSRVFTSLRGKSLQDRFDLQYSAEPMSGCWLWMGTTNSKGYGRISVDGKTEGAHRVSLMLKGQDPTGKVVMHACDVPSCVNPKHLRIGTHKENSWDAVFKGRLAHGIRHWKSNLKIVSGGDLLNING